MLEKARQSWAGSSEILQNITEHSSISKAKSQVCQIVISAAFYMGLNNVFWCASPLPKPYSPFKPPDVSENPCATLQISAVNRGMQIAMRRDIDQKSAAQLSSGTSARGSWVPSWAPPSRQHTLHIAQRIAPLSVAYIIKLSPSPPLETPSPKTRCGPANCYSRPTHHNILAIGTGMGSAVGHAHRPWKHTLKRQTEAVARAHQHVQVLQRTDRATSITAKAAIQEKGNRPHATHATGQTWHIQCTVTHRYVLHRT